MGGGDFTVPVQRVTDFLQNKLSGRYITFVRYSVRILFALTVRF